MSSISKELTLFKFPDNTYNCNISEIYSGYLRENHPELLSGEKIKTIFINDGNDQYTLGLSHKDKLYGYIVIDKETMIVSDVNLIKKYSDSEILKSVRRYIGYKFCCCVDWLPKKGD